MSDIKLLDKELNDINNNGPEIYPAVVWYKIPVLKDGKIYTKKVALKEFDNQHDADYLVTCTPLSYAGMVGWSYKEEFDRLYKDKLYAV